MFMTVETLISVLDKEVTFEVFQSYDNEILFDSSRSRSNNYEWKNVKGKGGAHGGRRSKPCGSVPFSRRFNPEAFF